MTFAQLDLMDKDAWDIKLPRGRVLRLSSDTQIMGILNLTPDSFYEGSRIKSLNECVKKAAQMLEDGALILDMGGQSTRPGSLGVSADEETERLIPAIDAVRREFPDVVISADTDKSQVALRALDAGADIINDISGMADEEMPAVASHYGAALVIMHIKGTPLDMANYCNYENILAEITTYMEGKIAYALSCGLKEEQIILDPGIGFAKNKAQNLYLMKHMEFLRPLGRPVLIGASRKTAIGGVLGEGDGRLEGTIAVTSLCAHKGIALVRVHDVRENYLAAKMINAIKTEVL